MYVGVVFDIKTINVDIKHYTAMQSTLLYIYHYSKTYILLKKSGARSIEALFVGKNKLCVMSVHEQIYRNCMKSLSSMKSEQYPCLLIDYMYIDALRNVFY